MKEYELLRAEIMQYLSEINGNHNLLYTAVAAILTFSFNVCAQEVEPGFSFLLFLLPYVVIFPLFLSCIEKKNAICDIASYMMVFLEGDRVHLDANEYNWENRHHFWDDQLSKNTRGWKSNFVYYLLMTVCTIISIVKLIYNTNLDLFEKTMWGISIVFAMIVLFLIMNKITVDYTKTRKKRIEEWRGVKKRIAQENGYPSYHVYFVAGKYYTIRF